MKASGGRILVIAHRTCPPYAPENSLQGIKVAADQKADAVEIDLRVSLDQRPFLMHDNTMWRTARWPLPLELTPSFLVRRRRLQTSAERVPRLSDALEALPGGMLVAVDVKTPWAVFALLAEVRRRCMAERVLAWCTSARAARFLATREPDIEVGFYNDSDDAASNQRLIRTARRLGLGAVSLDWRAVDRAMVESAHAAGLRAYSWHKDAALSPEKLSSGLDGIITDYPAHLRGVLESAG